LTESSPFACHAALSLAADGARVVFECGDRPYGEAGTALCEVATDGSGFRVALTPTAAATATAALRHPSYAPDGAIFFESSWDATVWRLPLGGAATESAGPGFDSDGAPCVLPDGRVASLWLGRPGNEGGHELKVMTPDGTAHTMLLTDIDVQQISAAGKRERQWRPLERAASATLSPAKFGRRVLVNVKHSAWLVHAPRCRGIPPRTVRRCCRARRAGGCSG